MYLHYLFVYQRRGTYNYNNCRMHANDECMHGGLRSGALRRVGTSQQEVHACTA